MAITVEATFENGVFVPAHRPALPEHERVRLTVEPATAHTAVPRTAADPDVVARHRARRIRVAPDLANEIATSADFLPEEA